MKSLLIILLILASNGRAQTKPIAKPVLIGTFNNGVMESAFNINKLIKKTPSKFISVSPEEFQFGSQEMYEALEKIADWSLQLKNNPLRVGDIAKKSGGKIAGHTTHQIGLDADIGYLLNKTIPMGHRARSYHNKFTENIEAGEKISSNLDLDANLKLFEKITTELKMSQIMVGCGIYKEIEKKIAVSNPKLFEKITAARGHEDHFQIS